MVKNFKYSVEMLPNNRKKYVTSLPVNILSVVRFLITSFPKEIRPELEFRDVVVAPNTVASYINIIEPENFACKITEYMLSCDDKMQARISGITDDIPMLVDGILTFYGKDDSQV